MLFRSKELDVLIVPACEITRSKPVGHINALFISDANPIHTPDIESAMDEARKQNAVLMLNHPGWPDDHFEMSDVQRKWFNEGRFAAVEIYNWLEWYPNSMDVNKQYKLAYMSNSDIHEPIADRYGLGRAVRPMTILFCSERSLEGVRNAIESQRTLAYFNGQLAGDRELMIQFIKTCLTWRAVDAVDGHYQINNTSSLPFELLIGDDYYKISPLSTIRIKLKTPQPIVLKNCILGYQQYLEINL